MNIHDIKNSMGYLTSIERSQLLGDVVEYTEKLYIALKSQHQPHMDYIPELDCTVSQLLEGESHV